MRRTQRRSSYAVMIAMLLVAGGIFALLLVQDQIVAFLITVMTGGAEYDLVTASLTVFVLLAVGLTYIHRRYDSV
ncbi:hypothetical protein [environmental halophage 1 AAJ-2005]|nr:hypothetical protein [environmental halophage 1 AAJ-2005]